MRPSVAIALIVMGSLIVIAPVVTNYFEQAPYQANAMRVVEDYKADPVNKLPYLQQRYPTSVYSYFCLVAGLAMVGIGVWGALKKCPTNAAEPGVARERAAT